MAPQSDLQMIPETMKAIAIDRFGGIDELKVQTLLVPEPGPLEVLIDVHTAGVGVWDPPDREGDLAKMRDSEPNFPYIIGRDGAGTIAAVGDQVTQFQEGDRVYTFGPPDPEANLYAQYAIADIKNVAPMPKSLSFKEAGTLPTDGVTALCGLDQVLNLESGETLLVFGASGGLGHLAVQLGKRMGAQVFAVASGEDGVALVQELGADAAVDSHSQDIVEAAQEFAPDGFDAALLTAGGEAANEALSTVHGRGRGRIAYPYGIKPEPEDQPDVAIQAYNGEASPKILLELNNLIDSGPFTVHVAHTFPLEEAAEAHRMLDEHFLGRIALDVNGN